MRNERENDSEGKCVKGKAREQASESLEREVRRKRERESRDTSR